MATLSKLCVTGTFGIVYLHTCELYPTCVRNGALGAMSTFARVGGVIAPYVMMLVRIIKKKNYQTTVVRDQRGTLIVHIMI